MTSSKWLLTMTDAGRAAIASADGQGLSTKITHVGVGDGRYVVRDEEGHPTELALQSVALVSERLRVPVYAGGSTTRGTLQILAEIAKATAADQEFYVSEVGFFDQDGVLLAVWSHPTDSLGYRGSLTPWILNLAWSWSDMPADAITVEVVSAPLSGMLVGVAQMQIQLKQMTEQSGGVYDPTDPDALASALAAQVQAALASANKPVRQPICVSPANGTVTTVLIPALTGSGYFSPDGYAHVSSQFVVKATDGTTIYDSGEVPASVTHQVPGGFLTIVTPYDWQVRYKGTLGGATYWSDWSVAARFTTASTVVVAPAILTPANGVTNVAAQPTITTSAFSVNNGGDSHSKTRWQISTDANFIDIVYDSGDSNSLTQLVVPAATLQASTTYHVRARHVGLILGASGWSDPAFFTTRANFVYVEPPVITSPTNGQQAVGLTPTITISGFQVIGGADTHQATQVQVRLASGDWATTLFDTGEIAATTTVTPTIATALPVETDCVARVRHKGAATGWSAWSGEIAFRTRTPTGSVLLTTVGQQLFTVPAGVYELDVELGGGGGGGGYYNAGAGGGYARKRIAVYPGLQITVTVGDGGINGLTQGTSTPGGTTSFGTYFSATGGQPGQFAQEVSAAGGIGVNGDVNYTGGRGGRYLASVSNATVHPSGAGGGGAAGRDGNGFDGQDIQSDYSSGGLGGNGNGPYAGKGGKGKGGYYAPSPATPGQNYGGGGAGGANDGSGSGSVAAPGYALISW